MVVKRKPAKRRAATAGKVQPEKVQLQRADWIKAGLKVLAQSGADAVLVPRLATALKVTKGSFYWHFSSRDDLLEAMIEDWRQHATLRVIDIVEGKATTAEEKIRMLAIIGTNSPIDEFGGAIELAVRTWARSNRKVRDIITVVDKQRISYLTKLYSEIGAAQDPELLACLHYSFSTGLRLIFAYPEAQKLALRQAALDQVFFPRKAR
jgi:AcrR family transcriptional regulator